MFERRLKIMLAIIFAMATAMFLRAAQLQIVQKSYWETEADHMQKVPAQLSTSRGTIYDRKGVPLAFDAACIDAAVDYRAIIKEPKWIAAQAALRLPPRSEKLPSGVTRKQLLADEIERVSADIDRMWVTLGTVFGKSPEEIEQVKQDIHARVGMLKRKALFNHYNRLNKGAADESDSSWRSWLMGEKDNAVDKTEADLDASQIDVREQAQTHAIVEDINDDQRSALQKLITRCPGLELKQSSHRRYDSTAAAVAPHLLGHLGPFDEKYRSAYYYLGKDDLRYPVARDLIGRDGLERLAEPALRGAKGAAEYSRGDRNPTVISPPIPGQDATTTIDLALQKEIDAAFDLPIVVSERNKPPQTFNHLHGAAVVIDVKTGEVLAMVSHPTYNLNTYDADYHKLVADEIEKPLMNRATQLALPPGSTAKTIIGAVAVTRNVITPKDGIECDGFLKRPPDGTGDAKGHRYSIFRCWTARTEPQALHHSAPSPQHNPYGLPDGWLILSDGIERSCNVFFETVAWKMKMPMVIDAFESFGLGQKTGIGIAEAPGTVPSMSRLKPETVDGETFEAGIGQGAVTATPLQMANVAATLARNGVWVRPRLLQGDAARLVAQYRTLPPHAFREDLRDLHLAQSGLDAIKLGMINVVRSPTYSGTGPNDSDSPHIRQLFEDLDVAGKTGSAQISDKLLRVNVRDSRGELVHEAEPADQPENKRPLKKQEYPIDAFSWFHGTGKDNQSLAHAWFMGYAPAHDPQIAFCVLVEYGGSGGRVAGPIGRKVLEACRDHGYLRVNPPSKTVASRGDAAGQAELLYDH